MYSIALDKLRRDILILGFFFKSKYKFTILSNPNGKKTLGYFFFYNKYYKSCGLTKEGTTI